MKRRTWLLGAAGAAGALVVGWAALPPRSRMGDGELMLPKDGEIAFNGWIKVAADGSVIMAMPRAEMGQGVYTALPMLVAEELDIPLARVRIEQAGDNAIYGNIGMLVASLPFHPLDSEGPQPTPNKIVWARRMVTKVARELGINATGGSSSMGDAWDIVRLAAASVRARLIKAAAVQWQVPRAEITVVDGQLRHAASGKQANFGELARLAAVTTPEEVPLKARERWTVIGRSLPRPDVPAKVDGSARFGLDVRVPDMRFAAIRHCPMLGGRLGSFDAAAAQAMPGVERVLAVPAQAGSTAAVAVVARTWWQAQQAVRALKVQWQPPEAGALDSARIDAELEATARRGDGFAFYEKGDVAAAEAQASVKTLEAVYRGPYLAHATMEPMNCTAQVKDDKVTVWAPTQVPQMARAVAARVAGVDVAQVTLHQTFLGGGFGRRLDVDFVAQAVHLAQASEGRAVQLIWSREEDTQHDFYRPANVARLRATLNPAGEVTALRIDSAGDAITPRWIARTLPALAGPFDTPDKTAAEGLFDQPYGFANQKMTHAATRTGVPIGFWRSVGHSHNAFFIEGFVDELAEAKGKDALAFRRRLLEQAPRYRAVLDLAAAKAGWDEKQGGGKLPNGRARGLALHESFDAIVAQVVEASIEDGRIRVHRVVVAIDCGTVVNPGIVAQQVESSVIFGLTAALHSRIDIRDGAVQQSNFGDYPMLLLAQAPVIETHIVESTRAPGGVGEPAVPPVAPALANALYHLTGKRQRTLPLTA